MAPAALPTRNPEHGFHGTTGRREGAPAAEAWDVASRAITAATSGSPEAVRDFLDSRHGRHLADDVANGLTRGESLGQAIETAIGLWMGWRIGRRLSREHGIPPELPYLTGWVGHFAILDETTA